MMRRVAVEVDVEGVMASRGVQCSSTHLVAQEEGEGDYFMQRLEVEAAECLHSELVAEEAARRYQKIQGKKRRKNSEGDIMRCSSTIRKCACRTLLSMWPTTCITTFRSNTFCLRSILMPSYHSKLYILQLSTTRM